MLVKRVESAAEDEVFHFIPVQRHADAEVQQRVERPLGPRRLDGRDILLTQGRDEPQTETDGFGRCLYGRRKRP